MNIEENRLQTFDEWPSGASVSPNRIARAGFFATKQGLEVECFSCHVKISEWEYGDQVMAKHRLLSPECPFVVNPSASGNVPICAQSLIVLPSTSSSDLYKSEQVRLASFATSSCYGPPYRIMAAESLARAGFFSTKRGVEVECFSCHFKVLQWDSADQVLASHRRSSPKCPFLVDPSTSGNVPISSSAQTMSPSTSSSDLYKNEQIRLASFTNWPLTSIITPESLARAGFYYLKEGDYTKCAYCKGVVRAWEVGDIPDLEHKRHFPACPFVIHTINPRLDNNQGTASIRKNEFSNISLVSSDTDGSLDELGVQKHMGPRRPNYGTVEARIRSFTAWPPDLIQTPEVLAQAGFYYEGMGDQVRCFHCDGGLGRWDPHDDPWTEHARWFPRCSFVKLVKGQDFINACALDSTHRGQESVSKTPPRRKREISERELQEHMVSPSALAALSIGINVERVKRAIREKLEQTGRAYTQPDSLVEAALNLQLEEDYSYEPSESVQTTEIVQNPQSVHVLHRPYEEPAGSSESSSSLIEEEASAEKIPPLKLQKGVSLEEENRLLKEARLCKICMDSEMGIVFLPCGHLATCVNCAPNLEDCPVCRSTIKATVRTFLS